MRGWTTSPGRAVPCRRTDFYVAQDGRTSRTSTAYASTWLQAATGSLPALGARQRAVVALMTSSVPWPKLDSRYTDHGGCSCQQ
jgi:hypothetical protein